MGPSDDAQDIIWRRACYAVCEMLANFALVIWLQHTDASATATQGTLEALLDREVPMAMLAAHFAGCGVVPYFGANAAEILADPRAARAVVLDDDPRPPLANEQELTA